MSFGGNQVDELFNGRIEQFGCYHYSDAKNDDCPLSSGDVQSNSRNYNDGSGNQVEAQILFFTDAASDAFPRISETAKLFF